MCNTFQQALKNVIAKYFRFHSTVFESYTPAIYIYSLNHQIPVQILYLKDGSSNTIEIEFQLILMPVLNRHHPVYNFVFKDDRSNTTEIAFYEILNHQHPVQTYISKIAIQIPLRRLFNIARYLWKWIRVLQCPRKIEFKESCNLV